MKKSKHFRKDVILARIIAAVILLVLIGLLSLGISLLKKTSDNDKNSQNSQNTESTENAVPGGSDTQEIETEEDTQTEEEPGVTEEEPGTEENSGTTDEPEKVYVKTTVTSLRLREAPNTSCATLARIPEGTKLEVLGQEGVWYKVSYEGKTGYISSTYAKIVEE